MELVVGSLNETKINAVKAVFTNAHITPLSVPSDVSAQPVGDMETKEGAINRAQYASQKTANSFGIGLEGGVMLLQHDLYLCNWGALVTPCGNTITASGARIKLPESFKAKIDQGYELSEIMDAYTKRHNIRHHEGTIGIFTNNLMLRKEMFSHIVLLLKGQMEYWEQQL